MDEWYDDEPVNAGAGVFEHSDMFVEHLPLHQQVPRAPFEWPKLEDGMEGSDDEASAPDTVPVYEGSDDRGMASAVLEAAFRSLVEPLNTRMLVREAIAQGPIALRRQPMEVYDSDQDIDSALLGLMMAAAAEPTGLIIVLKQRWLVMSSYGTTVVLIDYRKQREAAVVGGDGSNALVMTSQNPLELSLFLKQRYEIDTFVAAELYRSPAAEPSSPSLSGSAIYMSIDPNGGAGSGVTETRQRAPKFWLEGDGESSDQILDRADQRTPVDGPVAALSLKSKGPEDEINREGKRSRTPPLTLPVTSSPAPAPAQGSPTRIDVAAAAVAASSTAEPEAKRAKTPPLATTPTPAVTPVKSEKRKSVPAPGSRKSGSAPVAVAAAAAAKKEESIAK